MNEKPKCKTAYVDSLTTVARVAPFGACYLLPRGLVDAKGADSIETSYPIPSWSKLEKQLATARALARESGELETPRAFLSDWLATELSDKAQECVATACPHARLRGSLAAHIASALCNASDGIAKANPGNTRILSVHRIITLAYVASGVKRDKIVGCMPDRNSGAMFGEDSLRGLYPYHVPTRILYPCFNVSKDRDENVSRWSFGIAFQTESFTAFARANRVLYDDIQDEIQSYLVADK